MVISIAHLGPKGTYSEAAASAYGDWLASQGQESILSPCPSIAQTLHRVAQGKADVAIVPVENSIQGSVTMTLDTFWELDQLRIQRGLVLPIFHTLLSFAPSLSEIKTVYSHPQALGQCQGWLNKFLPNVKLVPTNATTESLQYLDKDPTAAGIASSRAAQLYNLPILVEQINDHAENCTRFWIVDLQGTDRGHYFSLALSVPANVPGALVKPLSVFAKREINLSRIESRPTKRSLGEYVFFLDLEGCVTDEKMQSALAELSEYAEVVKIFGSYSILPVDL